MSGAPKYDIPFCTIFLVGGALVAHIMVLSGNIMMGNGLIGIGDSTKGWSEFGVSISKSMKEELSDKVKDVGTGLTSAIDTLTQVSDLMDKMMPSKVGSSLDSTKNKTEDALLLVEQARAKTPPAGTTDLALLQESQENLQRATMAAEYRIRNAIEVGDADMQATVKGVMDDIDSGMKELMKFLRPQLKQAGKWLEQFAQPIQDGIDNLGVTIDKAQKMFDQVMSSASSGGGSGEDIERETFNLFDASDTGAISASDLDAVAKTYSIDSLKSPKKTKELVETYDKDKSGDLSKEEFHGFVGDASLPKIDVVVLRQFAKKLNEFAGEAEHATIRTHVAEAVVKYLQLVAAKNMTKVMWTAEKLVSDELPHEFTADVLDVLADLKDDPDCPTTADVGEIVVSAMAKINVGNLADVVHEMSDPREWAKQGKDPRREMQLVSQVHTWFTSYLDSPKGKDEIAPIDRRAAEEEIEDDIPEEEKEKEEKEPEEAKPKEEEKEEKNSTKSEKKEPEKEEKKSEKTTSEIEMRARERMKEAPSRWQRVLLELELEKKRKYAELMASEHQRSIYYHFLQAAPETSADPATAAAVQSGVQAKPETLKWVKELAQNASNTSSRFLGYCSSNTKSSSSPTQSFATNIVQMLKKVTSFIKMIKPYATKQGIENIESMIEDFISKGQGELMKFARGMANKTGLSAAQRLGDTHAARRIEELLYQMTDGAGHRKDEMEVPREAVREYLDAPMTRGDGQLLRLTRYPASCQGGGCPVSYSAELARELTAVEEVFMQTGLVVDRKVNSTDASRAPAPTAEVWQTVTRFLKIFKGLIPKMIDVLRFAQKAVGAISKFLTGLFGELEKQGPKIFSQIGSLYKMVWVGYFCFMVTLLLIQLFFAFYAGGLLGGLGATDEVVECDGLLGCCKYTWNSFTSCLRYFNSTECCFWSVTAFLEIILLLAFIVSLVLCIIGGVQKFISFGCAQIHILGEEKVCASAISTINSILESLQVGGFDGKWEKACAELKMATCKVILEAFGSSCMLMIIGGLLVVGFHANLIIDQAQKHERMKKTLERNQFQSATADKVGGAS